MASKSTLYYNKLASILAWSQKEVGFFQKIKFFQILRENNLQEDSIANEATSLKMVVLRINEILSY